MLILPPDWRTVSGGAVATALVGQVQGEKLRNDVARRLIAASLDLMVATWPGKHRPALQVETVSNATWRIGGVIYMYLSEDDDTAVGQCIDSARSAEVTVVLPPRHEGLKRRLLTAELRGRAPNMWLFDAFISWRTRSATIDQAWPVGRAALELIGEYNHRVNAAGGCSDSILVDLPGEP